MKNQRKSSSGPFIRGLEAPGGVDHDSVWLPLIAESMFAGNVRREREQQQLTQAALARAMTVRDVPLSQSAIAKLEREDDDARRPISLTEAAALAAFFDRTVDDMITTPADDRGRAWQAAHRRHSDALHAVLAARAELEKAEDQAEKTRAELAALEGR